MRFDAVPFSALVQSLMAAMIAEEQRWRIHDLVLPPAAIGIEPNDVLSWTSEKQSYSAKRFITLRATRLPGSLVRVLMKEIDPNDYDPPDIILPPVTGWIGRIDVPPQPMSGWQVHPHVITDPAGRPRRPAIRVSCAGDIDDVRNIRIRVRLKSRPEIVFHSDATPYAEPFEWVIDGQWLLPATEYLVSGRFIPVSRRQTLWSPWLEVFTPDIRVARDDLSADIIAKLDELQEWIDEDLLTRVNETVANLNAAADEIDREERERVAGAIEASERYRRLLDEIASIRDYAANAEYAGYSAREDIRRRITVRLEAAIATFDERITTAVSATAAIAERLTTFEAEVGGLGTQITLVDTARVDGDQALAQQIAMLSAGTDNQFDPFRFWGFDATVEDWQGNGVPTVSGGFLRPANHATDPYVTSPAGLGVGAAAYSQVRGRVRKIGSPVWDGRAWWRRASDGTWDTGRSATVPEPAFDDSGIGLITFNMGWTGTIDRIRLDLSPAQTPGDYYTIDWISIGSPSPGASRAELGAERTARISRDTALASDIAALEAELTDTTTGLTGVAGAVSALEGTVEAIGDTVAAHGTALTGINAELVGKAGVDVVEDLQAQVEAIAGGELVSQGSAVTAIRNTLLPLASEAIDQDFANFLAAMDGLKVTAAASNSLDTRISLAADNLDILSRAVTRVQAALPGLASATALSALSSRVTSTENGLVAVSSSITSINAALPLKADTADLAAGLALKASASALNALTARVAQNEDDIEAQADAITSINSALDGKADASALSSLSTEVSTINTTVGARNRVFRQSSTPSAEKARDLWLKTNEGNRIYVATAAGTDSWVLSEDQRIPELVTLTEAQASAITAINSTLPLKADADHVNTALASKASASALTALTSRVSETETTVDARNRVFRQASTPSAEKARDLWLKTNEGNRIYVATAAGTDSWVLSEDQRIPDLVTRTTAQAQSLTAINATIGDITADARFKMEVVTNTTGYARIGARVRYGTSGSFRAAGWYTDVPANPEHDTLFVIHANRLAFISGSTVKVPFAIVNDKVLIDDLVVKTSNIETGAVSEVEVRGNPATINASPTTNAVSITVNHGINSGKISLFGQVNRWFNQNNQQAIIELWDVTGDGLIAASEYVSAATNIVMGMTIMWAYTPPAYRPSTVFSVRCAGSISQRFIQAIQLKK